MTIVLLVLNLILNTTFTIITNESGRNAIEASSQFVIMDEETQ
jgi:hypothetical protein